MHKYEGRKKNKTNVMSLEHKMKSRNGEFELFSRELIDGSLFQVIFS